MITLPLPPSSHHKNAQAKAEWREQVIPLIRAILVLPASVELELVVHLYAPWYRDGFDINPNLPDWDRLVTPLQDAIADAMGFNDRRVMRAVVDKYPSDEQYCVVWLNPRSI